MENGSSIYEELFGRPSHSIKVSIKDGEQNCITQTFSINSNTLLKTINDKKLKSQLNDLRSVDSIVFEEFHPIATCFPYFAFGFHVNVYGYKSHRTKSYYEETIDVNYQKIWWKKGNPAITIWTPNIKIDHFYFSTDESHYGYKELDLTTNINPTIKMAILKQAVSYKDRYGCREW